MDRSHLNRLRGYAVTRQLSDGSQLCNRATAGRTFRQGTREQLITVSSSGTLLRMAPKLRTIRTAPRNASVTRTEVAAVMKTIAEERKDARSERKMGARAKRAKKPHTSSNA